MTAVLVREAVWALATCEDCGETKPCRGYTIGPTAPDGGTDTCWICAECREKHEEATP